MGRWRLGIVAALLFWPLSAASADETRLIFTTISSPTSEVGARTYHEWADRITAQGKGIVAIDVRDGTTLANSTNFYDRLHDDVMQISFGSLNYLAGKFQLSVFTALPFLMDTAEEESVVFWRLYKSGALDSEFDDIMPLFTESFPESALHFAKPLPSVGDNLNGLKVIASGKVPTQLMSRLGATPLSIPLTDTYVGLQRNVADGLYFPWAPMADFKLDEVTSFHIDASLGGGPGGVWMTRKKYASLPPAVRKVIDDNSGEAQSRKAGIILDEQQAKIRAAIKAAKNQTVVSLTPQQAAAWKTQAEPIIADWAATSPAHAKVLALVREEIAKFRAGK